KNMFLKDKRGVLVLVTCLEDRRIRIGDLEKTIGTKRLSFASAETLWTHLGVRPGAVTPLALVNDRETRAVRVVLDRQLMASELLNVHPLHNEATLTLTRDGFLSFLALTGHKPELVDFDALEARAEI
ncbi:MAG TPA: YbaK/EbsC family protein, partial [Paracoccaceae bacterium]|nr:YbaK/EbsC family protein [Paracoccaceae bacterium]